MRKRFGGAIQGRGNSWEWRAQKGLAYTIGEMMAPYAPSRQEILLGYRNAEQTDSLDEKIEIRTESGSKQHVRVSVSKYYELVEDPSFLAGVVDARVSLGYTENYEDGGENRGTNHVYPEISINASNHPLLEAISAVYGGRVMVLSNSGDEVNINGYDTLLTRDCLRWTIHYQAGRKLLSLIGSHLLLRREELNFAFGL